MDLALTSALRRSLRLCQSSPLWRTSGACTDGASFEPVASAMSRPRALCSCRPARLSAAAMFCWLTWALGAWPVPAAIKRSRAPVLWLLAMPPAAPVTCAEVSPAFMKPPPGARAWVGRAVRCSGAGNGADRRRSSTSIEQAGCRVDATADRPAGLGHGRNCATQGTRQCGCDIGEVAPGLGVGKAVLRAVGLGGRLAARGDLAHALIE